MPRIKQGKASRGSQKWLQILVNEKPRIINARIRQVLDLSKSEHIIWKSPLTDDDYAECRDDRFLDEFNINLTRVPLEKFWPKRGPVWDGLAEAGKSKILVEAKAHIGELLSGPTGAGAKSRVKIKKSLQETKSYLGSKSKADWSSSFYQYTNRLAHLYLLRHLNKIAAHLVFIYFINDKEMDGPEKQGEWEGVIKLLRAYLGIGRHRLSKYVYDIFIDINELHIP